jgi:FkbM family methyltransferase
MIVNIDNTSLRFDLRNEYITDSLVIKEIFKENVYEVHPWHFDDTNGVVVDIGANIGAFSIQSAYLGAAHVYAVEPEPHNLEALNSNIVLNDLNNKITVIPSGISDFIGTAVISNEGGCATIKNSTFGSEINIVTLNELFKNNKIENVNVLKIDVEGSEPEIIIAASKENLNKCKYIAIEFDNHTKDKLGKMVVKLSETHQVRTVGSWERGGMIFASRY